MTGSYPALPAGLAGAGRRVCVVTNEFHGLFKNGGIGTANTGLALALAEAGLEVTVLYTNPSGLPADELAFQLDHYRAKGIRIDFIAETPSLARPFSDPRFTSYAVYLYLRQHRFDVVYFHENCGRGFYPILAKRTGCFPDAPLMIVVTHGPHEWVLELNAAQYRDKPPVIFAYMERRSVEMADIVVSPSHYLMDWMQDRGWPLPSALFVEQNVVPMPLEPPPAPKPSGPVREIVFFGRMEARKGLLLFCDAIDLLVQEGALGDAAITFLGKFDRIDGLHSGVFAVERGRNWPRSPSLLVGRSQQEALDYLRRDGVLAVVPSLAENSPCVVLECLALGIPFIATNSGGTAELVAAEDRQFCLVEREPAALARRLAAALREGQSPARLAVRQGETIARWRAFHADVGKENRNGLPVGSPEVVPLISVCLVETGAGLAGGDLLDSLLGQSHGAIEIVAVDRFGRGMIPRTRRSRPAGPSIQSLSRPGATRAEARALAARKAKGDYVLFLDEGRVMLMPDCLERLAAAARLSGAALVTGVRRRLRPDGRPMAADDGDFAYLPLGACLEIGAVENCFGDGLVLAERRVVAELGGCPEGAEGGDGLWQFLAAAVGAGFRLEVVPQATFWRRDPAPASFRQGSAVAETRATLEIFRRFEVSRIRHLLERFVDVESEQRRWLDAYLQTLGQTARDLAQRLSGSDPNSRDALNLLLNYMQETGLGREALEFAYCNQLAGGERMRWADRETFVEFTWPLPAVWRLDLRLKERVDPGSSAARISVYLGKDQALPAVLSDEEDGRSLLSVTGVAGDPMSPLVRVRICVPVVYSTADSRRDFGGLIETMKILPLEDGPEEGSPDLAFDAVRLDEYFVGAHARHLDISMAGVRIGRERWDRLKFKFCLWKGGHCMEFRDMPGWPVAFLALPGGERDDFGRVFRASGNSVDGQSPVHVRDRLLLTGLARALPTLVERVFVQGGIPGQDREGLLAGAAELSAELLESLAAPQLAEAS